MCDINVTLDDAQEALEFMIEKLEEDTAEMKREKKECYTTAAKDENPWQCVAEPEPESPETEESSKSTEESAASKFLLNIWLAYCIMLLYLYQNTIN